MEVGLRLYLKAGLYEHGSKVAGFHKGIIFRQISKFTGKAPSLGAHISQLLFQALTAALYQDFPKVVQNCAVRSWLARDGLCAVQFRTVLYGSVMSQWG